MRGLKSLGVCPGHSIALEPFSHMKKYYLFVFVCKRLLALPFGGSDLVFTVEGRYGGITENNLVQV